MVRFDLAILLVSSPSCDIPISEVGAAWSSMLSCLDTVEYYFSLVIYLYFGQLAHF